MIICICGKSCSGKSTLAEQLTSYIGNAIYIDIDKIGHDVLKNYLVQEKIKMVFGDEVITNNEVNRKILGSIVFLDKEKMNQLTEITWPLMEKQIDEIVCKNSDKTIILDYLLLPKTKYFTRSSLRILLDVPYEKRKERALLRDKIKEEEFLLRDLASINYNENDFDFIVTNINYDDEIRKILNNVKRKVISLDKSK